MNGIEYKFLVLINSNFSIRMYYKVVVL